MNLEVCCGQQRYTLSLKWQETRSGEAPIQIPTQSWTPGGQPWHISVFWREMEGVPWTSPWAPCGKGGRGMFPILSAHLCFIDATYNPFLLTYTVKTVLRLASGFTDKTPSSHWSPSCQTESLHLHLCIWFQAMTHTWALHLCLDSSPTSSWHFLQQTNRSTSNKGCNCQWGEAKALYFGLLLKTQHFSEYCLHRAWNRQMQTTLYCCYYKSLFHRTCAGQTNSILDYWAGNPERQAGDVALQRGGCTDTPMRLW